MQISEKIKSLKKLFRAMINKTLSHEVVLSQGRKYTLKNKIIVLMYHEIGENSGGIDSWTVVRKSDFIRQMEYLAIHFNMISLSDALIQITNAKNGLKEKPSVVITFDDGYAGNYRILLPILKSMGIPVTIFVATQSVQDQKLYWYDHLISALQDKRIRVLNLNYLSLGIYRFDQVEGSEKWREIERLLSDLKKIDPVSREEIVQGILRELKVGDRKTEHPPLSMLTIEELREMANSPLVTIGAHSHCHNILTQLPEDEIKRSVETSKNLLESWTDREVQLFSYPNGNYDNRVVKILKETGFVCSLTTRAAAWDRFVTPFTIPRIGVGRYDSLDSFKLRVSGVTLQGLFSRR